ncbi:unnamed protein product [Diamesa tonsa]
MVLSKIFALLICSVVIASGSSCDNDGNVTAQDVKFLEATGGFFYIHGLTNGESVVMFQTLGDSKIQVQYTFINDDCLYETRSYNIHENGNMKDHDVFQSVIGGGETFLPPRLAPIPINTPPPTLFTFGTLPTLQTWPTRKIVTNFVTFQTLPTIPILATGIIAHTRNAQLAIETTTPAPTIVRTIPTLPTLRPTRAKPMDLKSQM